MLFLFHNLGRVSGKKYLSYGLEWVNDYICLYRGHKIRTKEWSMECCFDDTPSQAGNGTECGVLLLATAEYLSTDRNLNFTLADMPSYRNHLCLEILSHR